MYTFSRSVRVKKKKKTKKFNVLRRRALMFMVRVDDFLCLAAAAAVINQTGDSAKENSCPRRPTTKHDCKKLKKNLIFKNRANRANQSDQSASRISDSIGSVRILDVDDKVPITVTVSGDFRVQVPVQALVLKGFGTGSQAEI